MGPDGTHLKHAATQRGALLVELMRFSDWLHRLGIVMPPSLRDSAMPSSNPHIYIL
jgi:hypothetical protein